MPAQRSGYRGRIHGATATFGVAYAFLVTMLGTTLPTPLYPIYERRLHLSGLTVTIIYATYALGVIAALLLVGRRSDEIGRRPMLFAGLAFSAASAVIFLVAGALAPLLVGRVVSGLSAGIFTGTATAALVDLASDRARGTLIATAVNVGGLGLGPLVAGLFAQFAPDPLRLPYAFGLLLLVPAAAFVWLMPEPVEVAPGTGFGHFGVQRLGVPREVRAIFARAVTASFAAFAVLGLFSAVAPAFLDELLGLHSHWLSGTIVFLVFAAATAGQLALEVVAAETALPLGCLVMVAGSGLIAAAIAAGSLALMIAGAAVAGFGTGLCFRAGLTLVNSASPPERRAEVASSFFFVSYIALSIPIVGIGVAAESVGLRSAGIAFAGLVGVLALAVAAVSLVPRGARDGL